MDKRKIVRYLLITLSVILGVLVFLSITGTVAHAAGLVDNTVSDANTYSKYPLENYQLDFYVDSSWDWLPWNWLDGIGKSIAVRTICHHKLCLDGELIHFQCDRLCGTGSLQAGLYL